MLHLPTQDGNHLCQGDHCIVGPLGFSVTVRFISWGMALSKERQMIHRKKLCSQIRNMSGLSKGGVGREGENRWAGGPHCQDEVRALEAS